MAETQLFTFLAVLLPAAILGLATKRLGVSSIVGYVIAGFLVGPALGLVDLQSPVLLFLSELGIILISFQIGLTVKLDFIRRWGRPAGIVIIEVFVVTGLTFLVATLLNLPLAVLFVLVFMALNTSTAVAFLLMREERVAIDRPIREIVFGVGAFEDILSLIGFALLPIVALSGPVSVPDVAQLLFFIVVSITLMLLFGLQLAKYVIHYFGLRDKELLIVLSATLVIAYAFVGELIGLSPALGAFIAGLAASSIVEAEEIKEKFLTFTEIAALFFFAFVGASLPVIVDFGLVAIVVGLSLLIIFIKYFSFAISSWLLGAKLENSFRLGLYMLAISEFGIILALEGFRRGVVPREIFLVAVVAMVLSTIIASATSRSRERIAAKMASVVPKHARRVVEATMLHVRESFASEREELQDLKVAAMELLKRGAIVTVVAFLVGVLTEAVPPFFGGNQAIVEAIIITVGSLLVLATVIQSRDSFHTLILHALRAHREKEHGRVAHALTDVVHFLTIGLTALVLILFYSPFISGLLDIFLAGQTTKILVVLLVVVLFAVLIRRVVKLMARVDSLFTVPP